VEFGSIELRNDNLSTKHFLKWVITVCKYTSGLDYGLNPLLSAQKTGRIDADRTALLPDLRVLCCYWLALSKFQIPLNYQIMIYLIKFDFTCHKSSRFVGKSGEVSITTESPVSIHEIQNSDVVKTMIGNDMASKTGMSVLSVDITHVQEI